MSNPLTATEAATAEAQGEIGEGLEQLQTRINNIQAAVEKLESKIGAVLGHPCPKGEAKGISDCSSEVGTIILNLNNKVSSIQEDLNNIIDRVQL